MTDKLGIEKDKKNCITDEEQSRRIGTMFRLVRHIQRNLKICVSCGIEEFGTSFALKITIGNRIFVKFGMLSNLQAKQCMEKRVPVIFICGEELGKIFKALANKI